VSLRILADRRIMEHDTISIGAGIRNAGIILQRDDLLRAIKPDLGDFSAD